MRILSDGDNLRELLENYLSPDEAAEEKKQADIYDIYENKYESIFNSYFNEDKFITNVFERAVKEEKAGVLNFEKGIAEMAFEGASYILGGDYKSNKGYTDHNSYNNYHNYNNYNSYNNYNDGLKPLSEKAAKGETGYDKALKSSVNDVNKNAFNNEVFNNNALNTYNREEIINKAFENNDTLENYDTVKDINNTDFNNKEETSVLNREDIFLNKEDILNGKDILNSVYKNMLFNENSALSEKISVNDGGELGGLSLEGYENENSFYGVSGIGVADGVGGVLGVGDVNDVNELYGGSPKTENLFSEENFITQGGDAVSFESGLKEILGDLFFGGGSSNITNNISPTVNLYSGGGGYEADIEEIAEKIGELLAEAAAGCADGIYS